MSSKRRIYKHVCARECLRLDSTYFSRSNFLLVSDYGPLYFVMFIRNLLLICKIILKEGAGLHHRYIIQRKPSLTTMTG